VNGRPSLTPCACVRAVWRFRAEKRHLSMLFMAMAVGSFFALAHMITAKKPEPKAKPAQD
jgi:hypothetical protein